jgi:ParB-like chromosome segregation protein Spo0J
MAGLKITYKAPAVLKPRARNPRIHSPRQIKQIATSIEQFGFVSPVLVDQNNGIIAGHGRVSAAKLLGMNDIPTVRVDHLTPAQIQAYVIADNRLAENAGWDRELLALELQELSVELNFDVTVTGFEVAEVDLLIGELNQSEPDEGDIVLAIDRSGEGELPRAARVEEGPNGFCGSAVQRAHCRTCIWQRQSQAPRICDGVRGDVRG